MKIREAFHVTLFLCLLLIAGWFIYGMYRNTCITSELRSMGKRCLASQISDTKEIWGKLAKATFTRGKAFNQVIIIYDDNSYEFKDYNKSAIIGSWFGEKFREFKDGYQYGKDKSRKHDKHE